MRSAFRLQNNGRTSQQTVRQNVIYCVTRAGNKQGRYIQLIKRTLEKLIKLHEGSSKAKLAKRDMLSTLLSSLKLVKGELVANLHSKLKKILIGLNNLKVTITNRDILRSAINVFPRTTQCMSIIDSFYIFKDLEVYTLNEFLQHQSCMNQLQVQKK